jgi:hypothetical protein
MNYTKVEPGPVTGTYNFVDETTGTQTLFGGPEAEELKRRIEMTGDQRVAGPGAPGPAPATFGEDTEAQASKATANLPPVRVSGDSTTQDEATTSVPGGTVMRTPEGKKYVKTQGSAPVTSKDLEKKDAAARALRTAQRETVEGGYNPDEQYLEQVYKTSQDRQLSAMRLAAIEQEERDNMLTVATAQKQRLEQEAEENRRKQSEVMQRVEKDRLAYDSAIEAVRGKKVDANRLFSGGAGTVRLLAVAIAHGLSSYASAKLGRPDTAQAIINSTIDRDIAEQEHEITQGNKNVDNALVRLTKSTGSMEQAKILLKQLQMEHAMAQVQEIGANAKSQEVSAKLDLFLTEEQMRTEALREEYLRLAAGKHSTAVEARFAHTRAGSAGGRRPLTYAEKKAEGDLTETGVGVKKTESEIRKNDADAAKAKAGANGRGSVALSDVAAAESLANSVFEQAGMVWDPTSGTLRYKSDDFNASPAAGPVDNLRAKFPYTEQGKMNQTLNAFINQQIKAITGVAARPDEMERIIKTVRGDGSEEALQVGMQNLMRSLQAKKEALQGGNPDAQDREQGLPIPEPVN